MTKIFAAFFHLSITLSYLQFAFIEKVAVYMLLHLTIAYGEIHTRTMVPTTNPTKLSTIPKGNMILKTLTTAQKRANSQPKAICDKFFPMPNEYHI